MPVYEPLLCFTTSDIQSRWLNSAECVLASTTCPSHDKHATGTLEFSSSWLYLIGDSSSLTSGFSCTRSKRLRWSRSWGWGAGDWGLKAGDWDWGLGPGGSSGSNRWWKETELPWKCLKAHSQSGQGGRHLTLHITLSYDCYMRARLRDVNYGERILSCRCAATCFATSHHVIMVRLHNPRCCRLNNRISKSLESTLLIILSFAHLVSGEITAGNNITGIKKDENIHILLQQ